MKKIMTPLAALLISLAATAQSTNPLWLRQHSISPDGSKIAFSYQGDIFTVDSKGGKALQITSNRAHDTAPLWSPDGKEIIFSSNRDKGTNIFKVSAEGGNPIQLTFRPSKEKPITITPDGKIIFKTVFMPDADYSGIPTDTQLFAIDLEGGRPIMYSSLPISNLDVAANGQIIYEDYKGYEDEFRKHHTSSVTRDIWIYTPAKAEKGKKSNKVAINGQGKFQKLTTFKGEDRNPIFASDGDSFYYLSEQDGCSNIYKGSISNPSKSKKLTSFEKNPVRYLNASDNGILSFSFNGELYTMEEGKEPKKVEISLAKDYREDASELKKFSSSANDIAISSNGKEIALVNRGDVYVTAIDLEMTKRITDTPEQERGVALSKDGRTVYYASERNGHWGIWSSTPVHKNEYLSFATERKEELVTTPGETCFQPVVSPDGKWLAFLRNRTELVIKDLKNGKEKSLFKDVNYSYTDGDQSFEWSPDSKHILCNWQAEGGWNNEDIALINIKTGEITNLTQSGYNDGGFRWALGGKAMTWSSDKNGFRSHGSWGAHRDIYIMFFDAEAQSEFFKDEDDEKIEKFLKEEPKKDSKKAEKKDEKKDSTEKKEEKKIVLDLERRFERTFKLTKFSAPTGDHYLSPDGSKLYYVVKVGNGVDLYVQNIKDGSFKVVSKGTSGSIYPSPDNKSIYVLGWGGISKIDLNSGSKKTIKFIGEYEYKPAAEREYIFDHICKQVAEKFYDPNLHGVDWNYYCRNYRQFLPHIDNNFDFTELLSELLGELNASHTGARYRSINRATFGALGFFNDDQWEKDGLRIDEIIPGGALDMQHPDIKAGDIITEIEGKPIKAGEDWYKMLSGKGKHKIQITIEPQKGKEKKIYINANNTDFRSLYKRWVRRNEEYVEKKTNGKVGYVHVEGMDSESFREVFSKLLGKYRSAEAVIVDTRHNGGGWLHDDLATLLSGEAYIKFQPRGQYVSTEPYNKWNKPSCVLIGEDNYSDASGFPYVYKTLGIGKLIGAPVPGTMTAVWWENQVDASIVFGIPQVGSLGIKENKYLENMQVEPDILVYNEPASVLNGQDMQLDAAIEEMMKTIQK